MSSGYFLKLEQFEGPLDLLLHLIKVNEIDIFNIDIFLLTSQYLKYLRLLKYNDLSDAGEFLEMAATLIEIKSRMLLPNTSEKKLEDELLEDDPRKTLQDRLIEYEKYKLAAEHLSVLPQIGVQIQTNFEYQRLEPLYADLEVPLIGDVASLVVLYEQMLRDLAERKPPAKVSAKMHMVTVEQKIVELSRLLETVNFALFQGFYKKFASRYELVVHILAVLELSKWGKLKIYQQDAYGPMWIYRSGFDEALLPVSREGQERHVPHLLPETAVWNVENLPGVKMIEPEPEV